MTWRVLPEVVWHAERPLLRTAPAPLFLLSAAVHASGVKVVLTGEGADEMFAGYDLFREARVRRFWGREPRSTIRPRLLARSTRIWSARRWPRARWPWSSSVATGSAGRSRVLAWATLAIDCGDPGAVHARGLPGGA
ncbi:MAG: asparagine synthase-related protein [Chloroflexota bacterium]